MWQLLYEAAVGLLYLLEQGVIHGDLTPQNIVVGRNGEAQGADYGLAFVRAASRMPQDGHSLRWRAPECLTGRPTEASDVYSLGMCIVSAVTREVPFAFADDLSVHRLVSEGQIPDRPAEIDESGWALVVSILSASPIQRPTLRTVVEQLRGLAHAEVGPPRESESASDDEAINLFGQSEDTTDGVVSFRQLEALATDNADQMLRDAVRQLINKMRSGSIKERERALDSLRLFARLGHDARSLVGEIPGLVSDLVDLVRGGTRKQKVFAAYTLGNMATDHALNQCRLTVSGAIPRLVDAVRSDGDDHVKLAAAYALGEIAARNADAADGLKELDVVSALKGLLSSPTLPYKEWVQEALRQLPRGR